MTCQLALGPVMIGFRSLVDHVGLDQFMAEKMTARASGHLIAPLLSVFLAAVLAGVLGECVRGTGVLIGGLAASAGIIAVAARVWLAASGAPPTGLWSSVSTPAGELSGLILVAWTFRGITPALVVVVVGTIAGIFVGLLIAGCLALAMATFTLRTIVRVRVS
jgi:hypothetical protein